MVVPCTVNKLYALVFHTGSMACIEQGCSNCFFFLCITCLWLVHIAVAIPCNMSKPITLHTFGLSFESTYPKMMLVANLTFWFHTDLTSCICATIPACITIVIHKFSRSVPLFLILWLPPWIMSSLCKFIGAKTLIITNL